MKILVEERSVCGASKIYPICTLAQLFADLRYKKCLSGTAIKKIRAAGIEIEFRKLEDT